MSEYQKGKKSLDVLKGKKQFEDKEQASEPDLGMGGMLELSNKEFKTTMINMLRALMHQVGSMQKQVGIANWQVVSPRKN